VEGIWRCRCVIAEERNQVNGMKVEGEMVVLWFNQGGRDEGHLGKVPRCFLTGLCHV
jgi:hypothetical protein